MTPVQMFGPRLAEKSVSVYVLWGGGICYWTLQGAVVVEVVGVVGVCRLLRCGGGEKERTEGLKSNEESDPSVGSRLGRAL